MIEVDPSKRTSGTMRFRPMPDSGSPLTLEEYAAVQAGRRCGFEVAEVLRDRGIPEEVWHDDHARWKDVIAADLEREGPLAARFDASIQSALSRYARRIDPLEDDLEAWLAFFGKWSTHPDPAGVLARVGLQELDVLRLHERWSERIGADPKLRARRDELLLSAAPDDVRLPEVTTRPAPLESPLDRAPGLTLADVPADLASPRQLAGEALDDADDELDFTPRPRAPALIAPADPVADRFDEQIARTPPGSNAVVTPRLDPALRPSVSMPSFLRAPRAAEPAPAPPAPPPMAPRPNAPFAGATYPLAAEERPPSTRPSIGGSTSASFEPPRAAMPFKPPVPAPSALSQTRLSHGPAGAPLPFKPGASTAASSTEPAPAPRRPSLSGTMMAVSTPSGPATPFTASPTVLGLTLRQYAALCVEVAIRDEPEPVIYKRYHLDVAQKRELHEGWRAIMDSNPQLHGQWVAACATYTEWREKQSKAGKP